MRRVIALVLVGLFVATVFPATAQSAETSRWNIYDGSRDAKFGIDQKQVFLTTRRTGYFTVKIHGYEFVRGRLNAVLVYFDTKKGNTGPEYRIRWLLPHDRDSHSGKWVSRIDTWDSVGRAVNCHRLRTNVKYGPDLVTVAVPRSCLGKPETVRWSTATGFAKDYKQHHVVYGYWDVVLDRGFPPGFWVG